MECEALRLLNIIWKSQRMDINSVEISILTNIAYRATQKGVFIPAPRNSVSFETRLSTSCVDRHMNQLIKRGFMIKEKEHTPRESAEYSINEKELDI